MPGLALLPAHLSVCCAPISHTHEVTKTDRGGRPGFTRLQQALQLRDSTGLAPASPFSPAIRGTGTSTKLNICRRQYEPHRFEIALHYNPKGRARQKQDVVAVVADVFSLTRQVCWCGGFFCGVGAQKNHRTRVFLGNCAPLCPCFPLRTRCVPGDSDGGVEWSASPKTATTPFRRLCEGSASPRAPQWVNPIESSVVCGAAKPSHTPTTEHLHIFTHG
jgi:hypothetical protein